jgi:hypothetical protein
MSRTAALLLTELVSLFLSEQLAQPVRESLV